jgi:raffinose synthase
VRNPPALATTVTAADVEPLRAAALAAAAGEGDADGDGDGNAAGAPLAFACYQYKTQELHLLPDASTPVPVSLAASTADMLWYSPVLRRRGVALAPLGLVDMYNGGGAITSVALSARPRGGQAADGGGAAVSGPELVASIGVRGCGKLLMYSSKRPAHVWVNMAPRDFEYDQYTGRLVLTVPQAGEGMDADLEVLYDA